MIKGDIGYFGLTEWWLNSFSETERKHIINTYNPFILGSQSLIKGDFENTKRSQSIINFLVGLSGWFSKAEDIEITIKIFEKIEQLVQSSTSYIDLHFFYLRKIEIFYKHRNIYPNALIFTIDSCKKQIEISEKVSVEMRKEYKDCPLPKHTGYEQLAIIEEKNKEYHNAIALCQNALLQKWNGDWEKRIDRCNKKILKMRTL